MRRYYRFIVSLGLGISLGLADEASATGMAVRFGGELSGAFNTHSMKDWNDLTDRQYAGIPHDNVRSGVSWGGGPLVILVDRWIVGVHYERLVAKKNDVDIGGGTVRIHNSANAFGASGAFLFPSASPFCFGVGAAADFMSLSGRLFDENRWRDTSGSGFGLQLLGLGRYAISPAVSGTACVSYRMADIPINDIGGVDPSGVNLETEDYSGLVVRLGIEFHQP